MRTASLLFRPLGWTFALLFVVTSARAQDFDGDAYSAPPPVYGFLDAGLGVAIPSGDFRDQTDNVGFGGSLALGLASRELPFAVGIEGGFFLLDTNVERVPLSQTVFGVNVDVRTTNNLAHGHVFLRMQPSQGRIRPYVEGLIGGKYLWTETAVEDDDFGDNPDVFSTTNFDDWSFSYGVGAGAAVELYRPTGPEADFGSLSLLVSARWLPGSTAEYLEAATIRDLDGDGVFTRADAEFSRSRTDVIVPTIGVQFTF